MLSVALELVNTKGYGEVLECCNYDINVLNDNAE